MLTDDAEYGFQQGNKFMKQKELQNFSHVPYANLYFSIHGVQRT